MQSGFTKGGQQDKARLAKLLEIAKGQHRTMKQFAEECGVNPSTFSRISNEKMAGSSSEAVIRAIYEHRAPGSRISLMDLMQANGMVPSVHSSYSEYRYQSQLAKEIIMKEMTRRVEATGYLEKRLRLTKTMGYTPDMICENEQFGGNGLWAFDYMPCFNDNSQFGLSDRRDDRGVVRDPAAQGQALCRFFPLRKSEPREKCQQQAGQIGRAHV